MGAAADLLNNYDERIVVATRKVVIEQGSEELLKAIPLSFIAHI